MRPHSLKSILASAAIAGVAVGLIIAGCADVANLDAFRLVEPNTPPTGDVSYTDSGVSDAAECMPITLCRDMDGDGYVVRSTGCSGKVGTGAEWHPCSELPEDGWREESLECDSNRAHHPGASLVCGEDANCDGIPDVPVGGGCNAEETRERTATAYDKCGVDYPVVERCSRATACMWSKGEAVRSPRRYPAYLMPHDEACGVYEDVSNLRVEYASAWECYAQRGPGENKLPEGDYRVGFLVKSTGTSNIVVDVTSKTQVIAEKKVRATGLSCIEIEKVALFPCGDHQFRVYFRDGNSLTVMSTSISPVGTPGSACL